MEKELFEELLESVKQGGAIMKGATKPSRTIELRGSILYNNIGFIGELN